MKYAHSTKQMMNHTKLARSKKAIGDLTYETSTFDNVLDDKAYAINTLETVIDNASYENVTDDKSR